MNKRVFTVAVYAFVSILLCSVPCEAAKGSADKSDKKVEQNATKKSSEKKMSRQEENLLWAKFDSLSVEQQKELISIKRARIEQKDSIAAAKRAEYVQKCKKFDKMTIAEQRALLETREKTPAPKSAEQIKLEEEKRKERLEQRAAQRAAQHKSDSTRVKMQLLKYKGKVVEESENK